MYSNYGEKQEVCTRITVKYSNYGEEQEDKVDSDLIRFNKVRFQ